MSNRKVVIVDLFAGGGGASNGAKSAIKLRDVVVKQFVAINHWADAIATHEANHPDAQHYHCAVEEVDPQKVVTGRYVHLLIAGPSCTTHSAAKGGRSRDEQSRTSPWSILNWIKDLYVRALIIENVPQFKKWGPLNAKGKPIKRLEGQTFLAFIEAIKSQGYDVEWRVLNAADYGDATSRERLFILARRKGCGPIQWPEPTHLKPVKSRQPVKQFALFDASKPMWRTAREIIDWQIPMGPETSIFNREAYGKKPLVENTMRRIFIGLYKFGLRDFVIGQQSSAAPRDVDEPLPTAASAGAISLVQPFILSNRGGDDGYMRGVSIDEPVPAITAANPMGLVQPYLVNMRGTSDASSIDDPAPTVTAVGPHLYLAEPQPYLMEFHGGDHGHQRNRSLDEPLPTQDTSNRFGLAQPYLIQFDQTGRQHEGRSLDDPLPTIVSKQNTALVQPFLIGSGGPQGAGEPKSIDDPLPTVLGTNHMALVQPEPFIVTTEHGSGGGRGNGGRVRPINWPLPTISGGAAFGLAQPYLIQFNGTSDAQPIDEPLGTLTAKARFALCVPLLQGRIYLDIRFRMLQYWELAAAMSFPKTYIWVNEYKEPAPIKAITKMIGNAWPNETGGRLCYVQLR